MIKYPYTRHNVTDDDIAAVVRVLRSDRLTDGPEVEYFEDKLTRVTGYQYAVAVNSGTAALHLASECLAYVFGDPETVCLPSWTFTATARTFSDRAKELRFVDVDSYTGLVSMGSMALENKIGRRRGRAICIGVDYAGQLCEYEKLQSLRPFVRIVADSSHALGAFRQGHPVSHYADIATYSFHPAKHVAAGEGGALCTNSSELARLARRLRSHGILRDFYGGMYDVDLPGYNYRMSEIAAALARSQLERLPESLNRRRAIASRYNERFTEHNEQYRSQSPLLDIRPLRVAARNEHVYHLYVVSVQDRSQVQARLAGAGIGTAIHYPPVHKLSWVAARESTRPGVFGPALTGTDYLEQTAMSIPMYPELTNDDVDFIARAVIEAVKWKS